MRRWGASARALRGVVALAPLLALALTLPAGTPPVWVWVGATACSVWWAVRPEGPGGVLSLVGVAGWWAWVQPGLPVTVVPAAALLLAAHVSALVLGYGPPELRPGRAVLALWGRRAALLAAAAVPVWWVGTLVLDAGAAPGWVWPLAGALVAGAGLLAAHLTVGERIEG
ncbi:MAG: hypothetical protein KAG80_03535 [Nocardioides sp.]|jgi:hypothetical protein|nr:hypothetical protein [Nocardioides sp.]